MKKGNGRTPSPKAKLKQLRLKIKNRSLFHAIAHEAEKDLKRFKSIGEVSLRAFQTELKRSWKDLKRVAHQQF